MNKLQNIATHLEYLGYEADVRDENDDSSKGVIFASHPRHFNFHVSVAPESALIYGFIRLNADDKKLGRGALVEAVNQVNLRGFVIMSIDDHNDLKAAMLRHGRYDRVAYGQLFDEWQRGMLNGLHAIEALVEVAAQVPGDDDPDANHSADGHINTSSTRRAL